MRIDAATLKQQCTGKWWGIFESLGIDTGTGRHGPCPICGGGTDRFRLDPKESDIGGYICNQCGAGFGLDLVQRSLGLTFPETLHRIAEVVGSVDVSMDTGKPNYDAKKIITELWKTSRPLHGGDIVSQYLHSRKLTLSPENLRYCPACYNSDTKTKMPAMLANVFNQAGKLVAMHRTYLDGPKKADVPSPKKLTPAIERLAGAAIRLFEPTDILGVGEGIETCLAATQLFEIPTWAVLATAGMESWRPPKEIRKIVIFADNDSNHAGQAAAHKLAQKLYSMDLIVEVQVPELNDFADELERL